jgi:hypothetical protein
MNLVVADTSPLNYLAQTGCVDVLPQLFSSVLIPPAVHRELLHPNAPPAARALAQNLPPWLEVRPVAAPPTPTLLGAGEREAIALAAELALPLLADDAAARGHAEAAGLKVTGTVGVLLRAAELGLIELPAVARRLRATNFMASKPLWALLDGGEPPK